MFDCGCHDNDTSDALNMAFFVHSPRKPTTTQKNNGAFKNLFPTLLHCLQESLLTSCLRKRGRKFTSKASRASADASNFGAKTCNLFCSVGVNILLSRLANVLVLCFTLFVRELAGIKVQILQTVHDIVRISSQ